MYMFWSTLLLLLSTGFFKASLTSFSLPYLNDNTGRQNCEADFEQLI